MKIKKYQRGGKSDHAWRYFSRMLSSSEAPGGINPETVPDDREMTKQDWKDVAKLSGTGAAILGSAMTAPVVIMNQAPYAGIYANAAKRMAIDLPAFEVIDRLPTLAGQDRFTTQAGNYAEQGYRWLVPDGKFEEVTAPYINGTFSFVSAAVPGAAGDTMMRGIERGVERTIERSVAKKAAFKVPEVAVSPATPARIPSSNLEGMYKYSDELKAFIEGLKNKTNSLEDVKMYLDATPSSYDGTITWHERDRLKHYIDKYFKDLTTDNTYSNKITLDRFYNEEVPLMLNSIDKPVVLPEADRIDLQRFYEYDVLPRYLDNLKKNNIKLSDEDLAEIKNMIIRPDKGVKISYGYTTPGVGGYSSGPDGVIVISNRPNADRDLTKVLFHELHHNLRYRLGQKLQSLGYKGLTPPDTFTYDINGERIPVFSDLPVFDEKWVGSKVLSSKYQPQMSSYLPSELKDMEGIAMSPKYTYDKSQIDELGATAAEARFSFWRKNRDRLPLPYKEGVDLLMDEKLVSPIKIVRATRRNTGYGNQIGTNREEEFIKQYPHLESAIKDFYSSNPNMLEERWHPNNIDWNSAFGKWLTTYSENIKRAMKGIPAVGAPLIINATGNEEDTTKLQSGGKIEENKKVERRKARRIYRSKNR